MTRNENRELADYFRRRLQYLHGCYAELEDKVFSDKRELCRKIDEGIYTKSDPVVGKIIFHLELVVANTFRYTFLIAVCSFLEEALKEIAKATIPNYETLIAGERKGSWLARHMKVFGNSTGLSDTSVKTSIQKFSDDIILRNCVVHAWGKVASARDPQSVRDAVSRIESSQITQDGYLYLGDQVIPEAIIAGEQIADVALTALLGVSIT